MTPWTISHGILQARILEWVAYPFSSGSFPPRNQTGVSCIAGVFTNWAMREALSRDRWHIIYLCLLDLPQPVLEAPSPSENGWMVYHFHPRLDGCSLILWVHGCEQFKLYKLAVSQNLVFSLYEGPTTCRELLFPWRPVFCYKDLVSAP